MTRVIDLDGNYHNWNVSSYITKNNDGRPRSQHHLQAREMLASMFSTCQILEEVPITVRRGETLYLDFYIPLQNLCIEVHGEQHYKFVPFYHQTRMGFAKSQKRDVDKIEWCKTNGIDIIAFPYNEPKDEWKKRISDR